MPKISLEKKPIVSLQKDVGRALRKHNLGGLKAAVKIYLDYSGSFADEYKENLVQLALDRLTAVAMSLDGDGKIPVTLFHNAVLNAKLPALTSNNCDTYVKQEILARNLAFGGTNYSPPLQHMRAETQGSKEPNFVLFLTDGDCSDARETAASLVSLSERPVYVMFVGFNTEGSTEFGTLSKLDKMQGRAFDNAGFFAWKPGMSDDEVYDKMFSDVGGAFADMKKLQLTA